MDMLQLEELIRRIEVEDAPPPGTLVRGALRDEIREMLDQLGASGDLLPGPPRDNPFQRTDLWYH